MAEQGTHNSTTVQKGSTQEQKAGEAAKEELRNVIQGSREAVRKAKAPLGLMLVSDVKGKKDDLLLLQ